MADGLQVVRLEVGALATNCYLVWAQSPESVTGHDRLAAAAVDPGADPAKIIRALERAGRELEWILLTHGHADHIAAVPSLLERWPGATVVIGEADRDMLGDADANLSTWVGPAFAVTPERCTAVAGGETVGGGGLELEVVASPGHTPGGVCYLRRTGPAPVLFSGDTLFASSVGRCDLPGGSWEQLAGSLRCLAALPASTEVHPGHGPESVLRAELDRNPYLAEALRKT